MKIYRVEFVDTANGSQGFGYYDSKIEAEKNIQEFEEANDGETTLVIIEMKNTKDAILRVLNEYGSHPDNG